MINSTAAHTPASTQPPLPNFSGFKVPKRIATDATLAKLTANELRLLVYLYFRLWGARDLQFLIADATIIAATGMTVEQLDEARYQLGIAEFIAYELEDNAVRYFVLP